MSRDRDTQLKSSIIGEVLSLADTSFTRPSETEVAPAGRQVDPSVELDQVNLSSSSLREHRDLSINEYPSQLKNLSSFQRLSSEQKQQISAIYNQLDGNLSPLAKRDLINSLITKKDNQGQLIVNSSFKGESLLTHLENLAMQPLDYKLSSSGVSRSNVLTSLLEDVVNAANIDQGKRATCTVTSLQWEMCIFDPARYVGITSKLCTNGGIQLDGGKLELGDYVKNDRRSASSIIFQNSLMQRAAIGGRYDAHNDNVSSGYGQHKGLYSSQVESISQLVWEKPFTRHDAGSSSFYQNLAALPTVTASIADLRSGRASIPQATKAYTTSIEGLGRNEHALHVVSTTHTLIDPVTNQKYFCFRNPWGEKHLTDGQGGAILIDAKNSIYALPEDQFLKRTTYLMIEGGDYEPTPAPYEQAPERPAIFFTIDFDIPDYFTVDPTTNEIKISVKDLIEDFMMNGDLPEDVRTRTSNTRRDEQEWKAAAAYEERVKQERRRKVQRIRDFLGINDE